MKHRPMALLLVALALAGCDGTPLDLDAGAAADGAAPTGALLVESAPSLALVFGEQAEVAVRYDEGGAPAVGESIRFALEGQAHDSTLAELARRTDAAGRARSRLTAGSTSTVFRVRVSAERAAPAYVDVSVGNVGFGSLRVDADYDGRRAGMRRVVRVYPSLGCGDELPSTAGLLVTLDGSQVEARLRALPAGLRYAVTGQLEGPSGVVLAHACVDEVEVSREAETRVALPFVDVPLRYAGPYTTSARLELVASSALLRERLVASGSAPIGEAGSDAALLLDALEAELRARDAAAEAEALAAERLAGLEAELAERLEREGPSAALAALAATLEARLATVELRGPASIPSTGGASWAPTELVFGATGDPGSPPLRVDADALEPSPSIAVSGTLDADALRVERLSIRLPLGRTAEVVLGAEARARGLASPLALLREEAGCEALAAWVLEQRALASSCDDGCARAACDRALRLVLSGVGSALTELDELRARLDFTGSAEASDVDGDLVVDRWEAEALEGLYLGTGEEPSDPTRARLWSERIVRAD